MSTSTDAILFYGFPLDEETVEGIKYPEDQNDWDSVNTDWAKFKGPKEPARANNYQGPEWDAWREAKQQFEDSPASVQLDIHCSIDYPMYYVHGRQFKAYRGDVEEVPSLETTPEDDAFIKEFCERYGIPYQQPRWYLVSYYG